MFALTDETFAILKSLKITEQNRQKFFIPLINKIYRILGSLIGALICKNLKINYDEIEFCLTGFF